MTCNDVQTLLHGYIDYELDPAKSLEIDQHLQQCHECAKELAGFQALSRAIAQDAAYYRAPDSLQEKVRLPLRQGIDSPRAAAVGSRSAGASWLRWIPLAAAATVLIGLAAIWGISRLTTSAPDALLVEEVTASHVRSLMGNHLVDVYSSDQHTVKPWFDGKLDFAPPVVDLKANGFTLVGGRLDYLDNRPVAALVYRRHKHLINLFLWPSSQPDSSVRTLTRRGYHIYYWTQSGMNYWAVSDVSPIDLSIFVGLLRSPPAPAAGEESGSKSRLR